MKKYISILLIILMGIFMIPTAVFAEDTDPSFVVVVGGEYYDLLEGNVPEHVTFDSETNTITLDGFEGCGFQVENMDLVVFLKGHNSITLEDAETPVIIENGSLTIKGEGSLDIIGDSEANKVAGLVVSGTFTMDSGSLNVRNFTYGIDITGDIVFNGGEINVEECSRMGIVNTGNITANGGNITVSGCEAAITIGKSFKLNGSNIIIKNAFFGVSSGEEYGDDTKIELNKGQLVFSEMVEGPEGYAFAMMFLGDRGIDDILTFNNDNLYIDNEDYYFRTLNIDDDLVIVLAEEGFDGSEATVNKIAKNVSILPKKKKTYEVTDGDGQKISGSAKDIKIDADLDKFVELYVNEKLVDEEYYDLEEGSTIIKLKDSYIKSLDAGTYNFRVVFTDGEAEGTFEIASSDPETGDSIMYFVLLLIGSLMSFGFLKRTCEKN